jgi:SHS family sialic acid transporter-like MFS transporter
MTPSSSSESAAPLSSEAHGHSTLSHGQWMTLLAAFLGWMFDGFEMGIFPIVARPALQDMGYSGEVGKWMGVVTALFLLGAACGGFIFGWLGDRIGRVRAMSLSILTYSIFSGCCYFAKEPWHLGVLRFISALGMGGEWSLGVALVMECWPERYRPWLAAAIGAASNVGFALIGLIGFYFKVTVDSWRWVMLVGALPALLTFFIRLFVPESERWKASVSREASHPLKEIFSSGVFKTTLLAICFSSIALIGTWGSVQWAPLWADKMTGGKIPEAKAMTGLVSALGAIIGCIVGPLVGGSIGRRPAYFGLCLFSLLSCGYLFRAIDSYGTLFLVTIGVVGASTASFYGWLPLYLPELFPTRIRATGQGLSFNFGRILAAGGALIQGKIVQDENYAGAGSIVTLIYVLGLVLIWLAPETKGKPLPE